MRAWLWVLALATLAPRAGSAQAACGERAWSSIGVAAYHCPGGTCAFAQTADGVPVFTFSTEPWLRGIELGGPAVGRIEEGDVLVAVNDVLITTRAGGAELARLDAGRDARLTVRRGDRLVQVSVRPERACDGPTMLTGSTIAQAAAAPTTAPAGDGNVPIIDFTIPQRTENGLDLGLGMTLRCVACSMIVRDGMPRWAVREWPVIERVERDGVAWEAGLRAGDEIRRINGRDVRSETGDSPILAPPAGDFRVEATRRGATISTMMNRRIHSSIQIQQRHVIRIERDGDSGWGGRTIGAFAQFWRSLVSGDDTGPPGRIRMSGESWGPWGLGVLLRSDDAAIFEVGRRDSAGDATVRFRSHPVVAEVTPGGAGALAGLAAGDAITNVNGVSVLEPDGARALLFPRLGVPLTLTYVRGGRTLTTTITPTENK